MNNSDVDSWRTTAILLGIISLAIFTVQRSRFMFLDPIFEACIFHVPAILSVGFYIYLRRREVNSTPVVPG